MEKPVDADEIKVHLIHILDFYFRDFSSAFLFFHFSVLSLVLGCVLFLAAKGDICIADRVHYKPAGCIVLDIALGDSG